MPVTTHRELPQEIRDIQQSMEAVAAGYGLDFFETIFEMLDYEELSMFAAYGGFPIRYPHWRFGAEYDELMKSYSYGLSKIYEMVINTDPCYAYLLSANSLTDQKLVIAHVYGHCDFFKNNAWFAPTNRKMLDQMANHAARINRYIDRQGYEVVEKFIDACLSLDNLIDPHLPHFKTKRKESEEEKKEVQRATEQREHDRFPAKDYMDEYINPPDLLEQKSVNRERQRQEAVTKRRYPEKPQRDILQFLLDYAPLQEWQHDVLAIVRDEAYYFAPQGQTKIMNEGWASYWHSTIMTNHGLTDADVIEYADHHSGTMAMSPQRLNPYKVGIELFRDIEERWNRGQFGEEWNECHNEDARRTWDKQLGLGRKKIFEVRQIHNDLTFIDTYFNEDFCRRHKMFMFAFNEESGDYEIKSREFEAVKQQMLKSLTNHGRPFIYVIDGNFRNRGELYLRHDYEGIELKQDYAEATLVNLQLLWNRPVYIETVIEEVPSLISYDGLHHSVQPLTSLVDSDVHKL